MQLMPGTLYYDYQISKLRLVARYHQPGRLLDVGCGVGGFVKVAGDAGWQAVGVEKDEDALRSGRQAWRVSVAQVDLPAFPFTSQTFDVITLWHVIEHVRHPRELLASVAGALNAGGLVIVATPNPASLQARVFGPRWYHLDAPRHLCLFTPGLLRHELERCSLQVIAVNHFSAEHNWAGIAGSLFPERVAAMLPATPAEDGWPKYVLKRLIHGGAQALAAIESALGRGGTFEMVAEKV